MASLWIFYLINCTTQFSVISKLDEDALSSILCAIDKGLKEYESSFAQRYTIKGHQISQAWSILGLAVLAILGHLLYAP